MVLLPQNRLARENSPLTLFQKMENKMKRTPNKGGENRGLIFRFRVTADEKLTLQEQADREGVTVSEYVRRRLHNEASGLDRKDYIRLLAETGKQGSNLNQYSRAMNIWVRTGNDPQVEPGRIQHCIEEITRLSRELMEIIKHGHRRKNQG
jgi:hypothetical protein